MTGRPRIVFALPVPGYLRFFEEVIRQLLAQGDDIVIALDRDGRDEAALARAMALAPVERITWGRETWTPLLEELGRVTDYLRFMAPEFADKRYLRERMDKYLPERFAALRGRDRLPASLVRAAFAASRILERSIPSDTDVHTFLTRLAPDALVVSPLVLRGTGGMRQTQLVKAARRLGIPVGLAVASWDHLSSKGLIRVQPDRVFVWNEVQKREAMLYHRVPAGKIVITGAYHWDNWFETRSAGDRARFLADVGLPADRPYVLYAGSSRGIASPEAELAFVRAWLTALRGSLDPVIRSAGVMIRPHPANRSHWTEDVLHGLGPMTVWPRVAPAIPMTAEDHAMYFDCLFHSHAVVGINTSAMVEAAIVGRPVLTIRSTQVAQDETVHFAYLTSEYGGSVQVAASFEQHLEHLGAAIERLETFRPAIDQFVSSFVRPLGVNLCASDWFVDAVHRLCDLPRRPEPESRPWLAPVTAISRWMAGRVARSRPSSGTGVIGHS